MQLRISRQDDPGFRIDSPPMIGILIRIREDTDKREDSMKTEIEIGVMQPQAQNSKNCWPLPEAGREAWNRVSPESLQKMTTLLTP
jgi:hypothetical protein